MGEYLRFPSVVGACITTTVWWLALFPLLYAYMPGGPTAKARFLKFNGSFFLINVHLLNLPLALYGHLGSYRPLTFSDLWIGILTAYLYVLFYLLVLDPKGLHFYIILSPRTKACVIVYSLLLALYTGIFRLLA